MVYVEFAVVIASFVLAVKGYQKNNRKWLAGAFVLLALVYAVPDMSRGIYDGFYDGFHASVIKQESK